MINIFLKQKIKKLTKKYVRAKKFRAYKDIHDVIVLFDIENLSVAEYFIKTLVQDGKKVKAYSFDKKRNKHQLPESYHIWTKDAFGFFDGIPKKQELLVFMKDSADTLIDITIKPTPVLQYLFLNTSADFRVGFNSDKAALYDLLIEHDQKREFSFFLDQMLFYMKSLRTK
jgi:hypothetical protein